MKGRVSMERLTYWNKEYGCWSYHGPSGDAAKRLAAYEDNGLEPEGIEVQSVALAQCKPYMDALCDEHGKVTINPIRLRELVQSEQDGRLVVLPCKVGDTVYCVYTAKHCPPSLFEEKIETISQAVNLIGKVGKRRKVLSVYLTREEAEAALKGGAK